MRSYNVNLLLHAVELDGLGALVIATGTGFLLIFGCCAERFSVYSLRNLHYSKECPGPCNRHVFFRLVGASLQWPASFILRFPVQPFLGLDGEAYPLPFSPCQSRHCRLLPVDYFGKMFFLCGFNPQFPYAWTCSMYPCRTFLQNPIAVCRLIFPTSLGQCEGEFCLILQGKFSWRRVIQGKSESSYSVPPVVRQIFWTGYLEVFTLCVLLHVSAW